MMIQSKATKATWKAELSAFHFAGLDSTSAGSKHGIPQQLVFATPSKNRKSTGQAPLTPCIFIDDNTQPTILYKFNDSRLLATASADTQPEHGNGSTMR
jgi:hypothetical protein